MARFGIGKRWREMVLLGCCLLLAVAGCRQEGKRQAPPAPTGPQALVWPKDQAYTGAYVDFGEAEDKVTLEAIEQFEKMVGKKQAIIAFSSFWGEQSFPRKNLELLARHGSLPLVYWSPWDRPYDERRPPDRFNLHAILAGKWDRYIDSWADGAKAFGKPMLVSWGLEMNGDWFPWSGCYYGAGKVVPGTNPPRYEGPELFKKTFRYVVDRVRARGVTNILWGFHVNHTTYPTAPWNKMANYYPGPDYVDWLGMSVYGMQFNYQAWTKFIDVTESAYHELAAVDPTKPMVLAEWGVGEFPGRGSKAEWIKEAFELLQGRYSRFRAAVFWHERWQNEDKSYSNLRVNSSPEALQAYRESVAAPYWLDRPMYKPRLSALAHAGNDMKGKRSENGPEKTRSRKLGPLSRLLSLKH